MPGPWWPIGRRAWEMSLTGSLAAKFTFLGTHTAPKTSLGGALHSPRAPLFYFAAAATSKDIKEEYERWPDLPAIFGTGNRQDDMEVYWATGFASQQDELAMSFSRNELEFKMTALAGSRSAEELRETYRLCTTNQWNYDDAKVFAKRGLWKRYVGQVAYRPFDRRWTVLHKHVLTILRKQVMSQFGGAKKVVGLISSRAVNDIHFAHCFVTDEPVDKIFISSKTSTNAYVFPLYVQGDDLLGNSRRPNLSRTYLASLAESLGAENSTEDSLPLGFSPEDIFHYNYAVLHSPSYRNRYAEFLKIDFPRLPLAGNLDLFRSLARIGSELTALHLLEAPRFAQPITELIGGRSPEIEKISWSRNTVWFNKVQDTGFKGVPEEVWNFHIGGYQVCHKWLKDRKGRTLSEEDIAHYQKIVVALSETIRLMQEIDEVIEQHGGWPGAFQTSEAAGAPAEVIPFRPRTVEPTPEERYVTCVPLVPLKAAAGALGDPQNIEDDDFEWVAVESRHRLRPGMFVAQVVGKSMEPAIPDGAWCLFRAPLEGTRQGKTVLVQLRDATDPETDQRYTVKVYESQKAQEGDSWSHTQITLKPVNCDFEPIVLSCTDEAELQVVAELVEVIRMPAAAEGNSYGGGA